MSESKREQAVTPPFLRRIETIEGRIRPDEFPLNLPAFAEGIRLALTSGITFFVGENGSGKSTLLEAIASQAGFNLEGGSRDHSYSSREEVSRLREALRLSWSPKVTEGFFLRAESFFNFATYIDVVSEGNRRGYSSYGGRSLHMQSHGESFLSLFLNRFKRGLYILDEPEAALSPKRQLAFLRIIHDLRGQAQFIIATHSPILLAYPKATIFSLDGPRIVAIEYNETEHYRLMKDFLQAPQRYLKHLFSDEG